MSDIKITWPLILGMTFVSIFVGFLYMLFLRCCVGCMVWTSIGLYLITLLLLGEFFAERARVKELDAAASQTS